MKCSIGREKRAPHWQVRNIMYLYLSLIQKSLLHIMTLYHIEFTSNWACFFCPQCYVVHFSSQSFVLPDVFYSEHLQISHLLNLFFSHSLSWHYWRVQYIHWVQRCWDDVSCVHSTALYCLQQTTGELTCIGCVSIDMLIRAMTSVQEGANMTLFG